MLLRYLAVSLIGATSFCVSAQPNPYHDVLRQQQEMQGRAAGIEAVVQVLARDYLTCAELAVPVLYDATLAVGSIVKMVHLKCEARYAAIATTLTGDSRDAARGILEAKVLKMVEAWALTATPGAPPKPRRPMT